jgi:hypothetical protein
MHFTHDSHDARQFLSRLIRLWQQFSCTVRADP